MREKDRRKKKRRFSPEDSVVWFWTTTMIYILAAGFLGVLTVAFLIFNFLTIGNLFALFTKAVCYAFIVNLIFAVIITADYVFTTNRKKEEYYVSRNT